MSAQPKRAQATAAQGTAQNAAAPAARPVQDAYAELASPRTAPARPPAAPDTPTQDTTASTPAQDTSTTATPQAQGAATDSGAQPPVSTRWPDASGAAPSPAPHGSPPSAVADARPAAKGSAPSATLAAADTPTDKPTGSLQTLALVVGAALALAGITGSVIYRFAGSRTRAQAPAEGPRRRVNWDNWEPAPEEAPTPWPWRNAPSGYNPRSEHPRPVDFGFAPPRTGKPDVTETTHPGDDEAATVQSDEAPLALQAEETEGHAAATRDEAVDAHAEASDKDADAVDIDAITLILEHLAKEGPKLGQASSEAGFADFSQIQPVRSGARA